MRSLILLSLAAAACAGCAPAARPPVAAAPAPQSETRAEAPRDRSASPAAPAPADGAPKSKPASGPAPAPAANPGADPIVGDWKMDQDQFTLYMQIKPDGKTAINLEKTRASLDSLTKQLVQKATPDPAKKAQVEMAFRASMDKQIRLLSEFHGTWKRVGDYYRMTSYSTSIDKEPSVTYARIDGEKLISTDDKGVPKPGEAPAYRD